MWGNVSVPDGRDSYLEDSDQILPRELNESQSLTAGIPIWRLRIQTLRTNQNVSVPDGRDSYLESISSKLSKTILVSVPDGRDFYLE